MSKHACPPEPTKSVSCRRNYILELSEELEELEGISPIEAARRRRELLAIRYKEFYDEVERLVDAHPSNIIRAELVAKTSKMDVPVRITLTGLLAISMSAVIAHNFLPREIVFGGIVGLIVSVLIIICVAAQAVSVGTKQRRVK